MCNRDRCLGCPECIDGIGAAFFAMATKAAEAAANDEIVVDEDFGSGSGPYAPPPGAPPPPALPRPWTEVLAGLQRLPLGRHGKAPQETHLAQWPWATDGR